MNDGIQDLLEDYGKGYRCTCGSYTISAEVKGTTNITYRKSLDGCGMRNTVMIEDISPLKVNILLVRCPKCGESANIFKFTSMGEMDDLIPLYRCECGCERCQAAKTVRPQDHCVKGMCENTLVMSGDFYLRSADGEKPDTVQRKRTYEEDREDMEKDKWGKL